MRRSRDVRASVANLSPRNFGEFTMRNFRDTRTNVARVSHDGRTTVARQSCENLATIWRENKTKRHSYECRATLARMSRDCRTNLNENKLHSRESRETLSQMSRDCRATVARLSRDSRGRAQNIFKIRPKFANLSQKCIFNETAT